jgi:hypothetical protein
LGVSDFYQNKLFRKLKFRTHIYLRKSEDTFLNNIEKTYGKKVDIIIIYGDWSNPKHMKHLMPSSNLGLKRLIENKYKVLMIDEYCISKLCSKCNKELTHYTMSKKDIENYQLKNKKEVKYKNKHRLLVCTGCCSSENKITTFWNRNVNECLNMLKLTY